MSATSKVRLLWEQKPDFKIGPVETHFSLTESAVSRGSDTVTHQVLDPEIPPVTQRLSVGARELTVNGVAFLDELMALDELFNAEAPVTCRHWIFSTPTCLVTSLDYSTRPDLGSDGSGRHLAVADFDMVVVETIVNE